MISIVNGEVTQVEHQQTFGELIEKLKEEHKDDVTSPVIAAILHDSDDLCTFLLFDDPKKCPREYWVNRRSFKKYPKDWNDAYVFRIDKFHNEDCLKGLKDYKKHAIHNYLIFATRTSTYS